MRTRSAVARVAISGTDGPGPDEERQGPGVVEVRVREDEGVRALGSQALLERPEVRQRLPARLADAGVDDHPQPVHLHEHAGGADRRCTSQESQPDAHASSLALDPRAAPFSTIPRTRSPRPGRDLPPGASPRPARLPEAESRSGRLRGPTQNSRRRRKGAPPAPRAEESPSHPLGTYGVDWDEDHACIVGRTSGGFAYGVQWWEATYLLDDPELGDAVRQAIEANGWLLGPESGGAPGVRPGPGLPF